ncbi:MAG: glycerate kinase [Muribaculaceae bacterium]|nr:glycerate kinase [Muribaculaceae bacterium]
MIIIAPDKFKGTLSASEAARAISLGLADAGADGSIEICPMADGGEGTAEILEPLLDDGEYIVESYAYTGPQCYGRTPAMQRSSYALGAAIKRGADTYVAIGGTACCDGGAGMLQALGMKAYDATGALIEKPLTPELLHTVRRVDLSGLSRYSGHLMGVADVGASLLPSLGRMSALDFAAQKGFKPSQMQRLRQGLEHWARLTGGNPAAEFTGAGGGIGYALSLVPDTRLVMGSELVLSKLSLPLHRARLVITGEGCVDSQTSMGKVVATVARHAYKAGVPVLAVGGRVEGWHPFATLAVCGPDDPVPATTEQAFNDLRRAVADFFKNYDTEAR